MNDKNRKIAIIVAAILGCVGLFYLGGMLGQVLGNYAAWMDSGGVSGESTMKPVSWNPLICFPAAFSGNGIKGILMILLIAGAIFAYSDTIPEIEFVDNGRSLEFSPPKMCIQEDGHVDEK